jgi:hypothetical protein
VHKRLLLLERRQHAALFAARDAPSKRDALQEQLANLDLMFDRVGKRVSKIVQNCVVEAEVRPQILVKSLQIIERQELTDAKVRDAMQAKPKKNGGAAQVDLSSARLRCWYAMVISHLEDYIESKFEMLCSSLLLVSPIDVAPNSLKSFI